MLTYEPSPAVATCNEPAAGEYLRVEVSHPASGVWVLRLDRNGERREIPAPFGIGMFGVKTFAYEWLLMLTGATVAGGYAPFVRQTLIKAGMPHCPADLITAEDWVGAA